MIASLRGTLIYIATNRVVIEACGVGYDVAFCASGLKYLPELGDEVFLHIYTKVREDAIELFGFVDPLEKDMFIVLLGVSGVGPKVAMNILAVASPSEIAHAVMADDLHRLTALPGIGKKTAERLCLELKDKIQAFANEETPVHESRAVIDKVDQVANDVVSALTNLGYPPAQAKEALRRVLQAQAEGQPAPPIEEILRLTLRSLA
ncbi:MAG: Holliday junction branch migration protein RuvA [Desulfobulbaceae bacterium]|nr:Holliday junction branch migration protein RuvA [Desulfobulbaceae bacterium]